MHDFALPAVCAVVLTALAAAPGQAHHETGWHYSDRVYGANNRTPLGLDRSQDILRDLATQAGYADVGYRQAVLAIDAPRAAPGVRYVIALPADTLWHALLAPGNWMPGERSYVAVVDGAVPDSIRVHCADESSLTLIRERKRKP